MMGTHERMLARTMVNDYAGPGRRGVDVFRRGRGPFDDPDHYARRFEIRQIGGRMVIVPLD
jgi:hypothetical protein